MSNSRELDDWIDADVTDPDGLIIGEIRQVFLDSDSQAPGWITINTGFFRERDSLVPLLGASWVETELVLPITVQVINDAPDVDYADHVTAEQGRALLDYYRPHLTDEPSENSLAGPESFGKTRGWDRFQDR